MKTKTDSNAPSTEQASRLQDVSAAQSFLLKLPASSPTSSPTPRTLCDISTFKPRCWSDSCLRKASAYSSSLQRGTLARGGPPNCCAECDSFFGNTTILDRLSSNPPTTWCENCNKWCLLFDMANEDAPVAPVTAFVAASLLSSTPFSFDNAGECLVWLERAFATSKHAAPDETNVRTIRYSLDPRARIVLSSLVSNESAAHPDGTTDGTLATLCRVTGPRVHELAAATLTRLPEAAKPPKWSVTTRRSEAALRRYLSERSAACPWISTPSQWWLGTDAPCIPIPLRDIVKKQLAKIEQEGATQRIDEPTHWCAGLVISKPHKRTTDASMKYSLAYNKWRSPSTLQVPTMGSQMKNMVENCPNCATSEWGGFFYDEGTDYLLLVDYYTRYPRVLSLCTTTSTVGIYII
ncbi:hypothetical protein HPB52_009339 [Rhipicephalus sanguineus]|uniref:Uncharacterized protein n=1 Tax=Rhipicephalus sanguineus TaxID=34632 RepID=A0A9D4QCI6_RHISA|nr:hypothetical protein HPB52_009339 [Rhipicephalus sanguineus]